MEYSNITKGIFQSRPNRFIAYVLIDGVIETVHVKNTGRCRELLLPNSTVYLVKSDNEERKTKYDLVAVEKKVANGYTILINMDSQLPNAMAEEWITKSGIFSTNAVVKREVTYHNSRFDLFVSDGDRKAFIEVKGVTLEKDGVAMFPDAPTARAVKHLSELVDAIQEGYESYLLLVIQMKGVKYFTPNIDTDPAFSRAIMEANNSGVKVIAYDSIVTPIGAVIDKEVKVLLK